MLVTIPGLLGPAELDAVCSVLRRAGYADGAKTAGRTARAGKKNLELDTSPETVAALNDVVMTRLVRHPTYLQCALPAKICAPIYARYTAGMHYAGHIDDPVMGPPDGRYRSDISITVFLNPPGEYEGGELEIESSRGRDSFKLPAGDALLYPSTHYHSVAEVTGGERLVAVTWVQSLVRRADQREILVQLDRARQALAASAEREAFRRLDIAYANLIRLWAEP